MNVEVPRNKHGFAKDILGYAKEAASKVPIQFSEAMATRGFDPYGSILDVPYTRRLYVTHMTPENEIQWGNYMIWKVCCTIGIVVDWSTGSVM
jgi:hypothetical protein